MQYLWRCHRSGSRRSIARRRRLEDLTDHEKESLGLDMLEQETFAHEGRTLSLDTCIEDLALLIPEETTPLGQHDELYQWGDNEEVRALFTAVALHIEAAPISPLREQIMQILQRLESRSGYPRSLALRASDLQQLLDHLREIQRTSTSLDRKSQLARELLGHRWESTGPGAFYNTLPNQRSALRHIAAKASAQLFNMDPQPPPTELLPPPTGDITSLVTQLLALYDRIEDIIAAIFHFGQADTQLQHAVWHRIEQLLSAPDHQAVTSEKWLLQDILPPLMGTDHPLLRAAGSSTSPWTLGALIAGTQTSTNAGQLLVTEGSLPGYQAWCYARENPVPHALQGCHLVWAAGTLLYPQIPYLFGIALPKASPHTHHSLDGLVHLLLTHTAEEEYALLSFSTGMSVDHALLHIQPSEQTLTVITPAAEGQLHKELFVPWAALLAMEVPLTLQIARWHPDVLETIPQDQNGVLPS
ncbi:hypothetical protein H6771_00685 [Candidatus Peribacteria bacterium]|nr:hypothetical protein [Candidatus Peribacteria bacterium]